MPKMASNVGLPYFIIVVIVIHIATIIGDNPGIIIGMSIRVPFEYSNFIRVEKITYVKI